MMHYPPGSPESLVLDAMSDLTYSNITHGFTAEELMNACGPEEGWADLTTDKAQAALENLVSHRVARVVPANKWVPFERYRLSDEYVLAVSLHVLERAGFIKFPPGEHEYRLAAYATLARTYPHLRADGGA